MATVMLVHGAFHDGSCWDGVAGLLRRRGHTVLVPPLTGLSPRCEETHRSIGLATHVDDVARALDAAPGEVLAVGASYGCLPLLAALGRRPGRARAVALLDAPIVERGQSILSSLAPQAQATLGLYEDFIPAPHPASFGILASAPALRLCPQPMRTYTDTVDFDITTTLAPTYYLACTRPLHSPLGARRDFVARRTSWTWRELPFAHDAMITHPGPLAYALSSLVLPPDAA